MKKISLLLLLIAAIANAEVIKRGAPLSKDIEVVPLAEVLADPDAHAKAPIIVEGVVTSACTNKGCWMQLDGGVRVTFKDYAFFVPTNSKGMRVRAEGLVKVRTLSKDEADHLEEEGAKLSRGADGTAKEVSFVATGVELTRGSS